MFVYHEIIQKSQILDLRSEKNSLSIWLDISSILICYRKKNFLDVEILKNKHCIAISICVKLGNNISGNFSVFPRDKKFRPNFCNNAFHTVAFFALYIFWKAASSNINYHMNYYSGNRDFCSGTLSHKIYSFQSSFHSSEYIA